MSLPEKRLYEFGPFRLDVHQHVLLRDSEVVRAETDDETGNAVVVGGQPQPGDDIRQLGDLALPQRAEWVGRR